MSAEVHIMCDVCKNTIYRGTTPMEAHAVLEAPALDAPLSETSKLRPMHAVPPPNHSNGSVVILNEVRRTVREWQTCSIGCTRKAANEALDWIFKDRLDDQPSGHVVSIQFMPGGR